jgi:predicted RND superfamily exporter protein
MSLCGLPVSLLNYIIPALIVVVGATEDMHILHEYRSQVSKHGSGRRALDESALAIGLALLLTASTTILGFAATASSTLPILQTFGLSAMIGMSVRFLISVMVLPATLALFRRAFSKGAERALITPLLARRIARFLNRKITPQLIPVLGLLFLVAVVAVYFSGKIRISNDLTSFIDVDSQLSRNVERSAERLAGSKILFLTLYAQAGDFKQPTNLKALDEVGNYLRSIEELDTVVSFADFIKRINEQLRGGDPKDYVIPDSSAAIYQMLLFSRQEDFAAYVSSDYARANIIIRCDINDSTLLNQRAEEIREVLASGRFGPQVFTLTGESLVVASAVDAIVTAQVVSLGGMAIALFLVVSGLFLSTRCGLLTVTSNLFPILLVFGLMGLTGTSLNVGTCMIAAITLGIAIDDTLHLLVRFNRELKKTKRERTAIENAVRHEMNPIVSTTIALSGGFLVLAFSSFAPVREFGMLSAAVLLLALVTDLIVTPMLFAHTRLITLWDLVGLKLRTQLLQQSPLFKGFSRWQAKKIILASQKEQFKAGTQVLRYNDLGSKMYVVLSGELEASIGEGDTRRSLTRIKVGDVLGEVAIVAKVRRSADVFALTDTTVLSLDAPSLTRLQKFSPFLASKMFLNIAAIIGERLTERIEQSVKNDPS